MKGQEPAYPCNAHFNAKNGVVGTCNEDGSFGMLGMSTRLLIASNQLSALISGRNGVVNDSESFIKNQARIALFLTDELLKQEEETR